ncbi:MAG: hypothetical protein ACLQBY_17660 [Solirubrobacteraceae bacterium]
MHVWYALLARELVMFAFLLLVGVGPVAFLPPRVDRASRLALAPAFGLAVSMCVLVTSVWRLPVHRTAWLLPLLAAASVTVAVWRAKRAAPETAERAPWRIGASAVVQLLLVAVVVMGSLSLPLVRRDSVGPVGYGVADAGGYVLEQDGMEAESIYAAERQHPPWRDLTIEDWHAYASGFVQIGYDTVSADVDVLLGLGATQTYSSFVIALLLVGAFGAFAVVRVATRARSWPAPFAGALFGGSFFIQLFMDGSEGALTGLALVLPLLLVGYFALRDRRAANLILFALLAAGLHTAYPLFVPPLALGGAFVLGLLGLRSLRRGAGADQLARAAGSLTGVLVLAAALSPVAFERNVRYWHGILDGSYKISMFDLPQYELPIGVLPGWLAQSRSFYDLPSLESLTAQQTLNSIFVPLLLIAAILYGLWRYRAAAIAIPVAAAAGLLAYYTMAHDQCSYCVQRNLLVVEPLTAAGIGVALAALLAARGRTLRLMAGAIAIVTVVAVGDKALDTDRLVADAAYIFDRQTREALSAVPRPAAGTLELEGFGQGPKAQMEEPLVYSAARETLGRPPSISAESDDNHGLQYLGGPRPLGVEFDPGYRYVLTRLAGINTARRTIARYGAIALQERAQPLDALVTSGVDVALARNDPQGLAWVQGVPVTVWVTGATPNERVWVQLDFQITTPGPVDVGRAAGVPTKARRTGAHLVVCLQAPSEGTVRRVAVPLGFTAIPQPPEPEEYGIPDPPHGLRLAAVYPLDRPCDMSAFDS